MIMGVFEFLVPRADYSTHLDNEEGANDVEEHATGEILPRTFRKEGCDDRQPLRLRDIGPGKTTALLCEDTTDDLSTSLLVPPLSVRQLLQPVTIYGVDYSGSNYDTM